ncbi:hypothetical protein BC826DRAFT_1041478, partial [Russula brevipes]
MQVAGVMLAAMDLRTAGQPWRVHTRPASADSLVPAYTHVLPRMQCVAPSRLCWRGRTTL